MRDLNACLHRGSQRGNSFYFPFSPYEPITRTPSMSTGHIFLCHLLISWSFIPVDIGTKQKSKRRRRCHLSVFPVRELPSLGLRLEFLAPLSYLGLPFQAYITQATLSSSTSVSFATSMLIWPRCLSSKRDGSGHVMFPACPYCHVIKSIHILHQTKKVIPDLHEEFCLMLEHCVTYEPFKF